MLLMLNTRILKSQQLGPSELTAALEQEVDRMVGRSSAALAIIFVGGEEAASAAQKSIRIPMYVGKRVTFHSRVNKGSTPIEDNIPHPHTTH